MTLGPIGQIIKKKLEDKFSPGEIRVVDESSHHAGHAGAKPEGETHFAVTVISEVFANMPLVRQHGLINEILADELKTRVHALRIKTGTG